VQEYAFELALCGALEPSRGVLARQLGAAVHGRRVADVVRVEPGPEFDRRRAITADTIPPLAIESDVGPGRARPVTDAFDCRPDRARAIAERAAGVGFFERERRGSRTYVRQTTRYPDWIGSLVGIENKPDLDRPGELADQLRTDVSLGLFDEVVLATASYVTGAHLNRLPEEVGVWRFDPETGEREVVRESARLDADGPGIELLDRDATAAQVRPVTAAAKARQRRRIAERAYGKGWRPDAYPACARCDPAAATPADLAGAALPWCTWHERPVRPATECGSDCPGFAASDPPEVDPGAVRAERSGWNADPEGLARRQVGLDRFGGRE